MPRVVPTQIIAFIDEEFSFAQARQPFNVDMQFKDRVTALLRLVDELPDELIRITDREYNRFVRSVETMRSTIALWDAHGVTQAFTDRRLGGAITDLRDSLLLLDDQQVPAEIAGLTFITDADLRESIRADIAFADNAFSGTEWKAATVLAGAVVEALLLWAINERPSAVVQASLSKLQAANKIPKNISKDPDTWTLDVYRQVAADLGIVKGSAVTQIELTQGFRNLIHPGKARRTSQQCSRSTAHNALGAMERLIEDFSK
jgi:hypothetical protein